MNAYNHNLLTLVFYNIRKKIKIMFEFTFFLWQTNIIVDFIYNKREIFIIVNTNAKKNLTYYVISKILGNYFCDFSYYSFYKGSTIIIN